MDFGEGEQRFDFVFAGESLPPSLPELVIPETRAALLSEVERRDERIRELMRLGAWTELYLPALQAKELALALTGVLGLLRWRSRRRKERIDEFYRRALGLRREAGTGHRADLVARLTELEEEAFGKLMDEQLAADESFRIFITLSNDVLRQLGQLPAGTPIGDA